MNPEELFQAIEALALQVTTLAATLAAVQAQLAALQQLASDTQAAVINIHQQQ